MNFPAIDEKSEKLKKELSDIIYEYEDLVNKIIPQLEHNYIMEFGSLEYKLYLIDFEIYKVEVKIRKIQGKINHQLKISMAEIEEELEKELEGYMKRVKALQIEIKMAHEKELLLHELSGEDVKELKRLYKIIIKCLHPDLNKNLTEKEKELFLQATEAYKQGNIRMLQSIEILVNEDRTDEFERDEKTIKQLIKEFEDKILKIKSEYPYNKIDYLTDTKLKNEHKNELKSLIKQKEKRLKIYNDKVNKMIKDVQHSRD